MSLSAGGVILILICLSGIISSLYVITSIIRIGSTTLSTMLILILNISVCVRNICLIPYLYVESKPLCEAVGGIAIYSLFLILIVTYFMVVNLTDGLFQTVKNKNFEKYYYLYLFIPPLFVVIYPLATRSIGTGEIWCIIGDTTVFYVISGMVWIIIIAMIYEFYRLFSKLYGLSPDLYNEWKGTIYKGPGAYAITCFVFSFLINLIHVFSTGKSSSSFIFDVSCTTISYICGIAFAIIFYQQKVSIVVSIDLTVKYFIFSTI
jgi:hypothetical protein